MAKQYKIRWNESDSKQLSKAVKNFNAKVSRLEKKYGHASGIALPEKVSMKEMKELIGTRRDLNREIKSLQRFTERGAEKLVDVPTTENNIKMTKWQKTEMNRRIASINVRRKKRLEEVKDIEMTSAGTPLGYTVSEFGMGQADELSLKPMNAFTPKMDKYDLQKKYKSIRKHSQLDYFTESDKRLIDNYIKGLEETYGKDAVADVVKEIRGMDFSTFYKKFKAEPDAFEYASKVMPDVDKQAYLEHIQATWLPNKR